MISQRNLIEPNLPDLDPETPPSLCDWSETRAQIIATVAALESKVDLSKAFLDLAHDEMKSWISLIEQRESLIQAILDSSPDIIITVDSDGVITEFNHSAERTFGTTKENLKGVKLNKIIAASDCATAIFSFLGYSDEKPTDTPLSMRYRGELKTIGARTIIAEVVVTRVRTQDSCIYPIYIRDLTDEVRARREVEESRSQAAHAAKMASLGEMAGGIAHEINTPLNIFSLSAEILRDAALEGSLTTDLVVSTAHSIEATSGKIAKIISGLRRFCRNDSQEAPTEFAIDDIVQETLSLCRQKFDGHGVNLTVQEANTEFRIKGQLTGLCQVLLNLLNNAHDAVEDQDAKVIRIGWQRNGSRIELFVEDSGPGIPKQFIDKIAQPFHTTKPIGKGTGLGLSISKGIIESHGGDLIYQRLGNRTRFIMSLPALIEFDKANPI